MCVETFQNFICQIRLFWVWIQRVCVDRSAPRTTKIWGETKVVPKGDDVVITGHVLTDVSQTAAEIENKSRVKNKDHRVFLDGIYKFEKKKGIEK